MSAEENKALVKRYLEHGFGAAGRGNPEVMHDYFHEDYVYHVPLPHSHTGQGREGMKAEAGEAVRNAPDLQIATDLLIAEGDLVAAHWTARGTETGVRAHRHAGQVGGHGRDFTVAGVMVFRVRDGKIAEMWNYDNHLDLMLETGQIVPASSQK